jgi:hypothetical protein
MSSFPADPPVHDEGTGVAAATAGPVAPAEPVGHDAEHAERRRQGAKAAARGEGRQANPMLDSVNQPDRTGESRQVWSHRRDAWDSGHGAQRSPPRGTPSLAAGDGAVHARAADEAIFGVTRVLTFAGEKGLTSASGFFFERDGRLFVVTSRHVLFDGPSDHSPERIEIAVRTDARDLTRLATLSILLYRDGVATWHQARDGGGEVDVAALELDRSHMPADCAIRAFGPQHLPSTLDQFDVGARLAIPGFPLGFFDTLHHLPVVRQASIASYYGVRFQGLGMFLTDARMHRGSSGSPVLAPVAESGTERPRWRLLGVHSSRMDMASRDTVQDESLGLNCAWYADVLMTLTEPRAAGC